VAERLRVLAVDDCRLMRLSLKHRLGLEGYEVDLACSAQEAMELLDRRHYDLVVTDLRLTDTSGLAVIEYARMSDPAIRIILLTGSSEDADRRAAVEAGAEAVFLKPCRLAEIAARAHDILQGTITALPKARVARTDGA
jgi:DNA-binding response OmpR family regulator